MRFVIIPTSPPLLPSFRDCGERSTADPLLSLSLSLSSLGELFTTDYLDCAQQRESDRRQKVGIRISHDYTL